MQKVTKRVINVLSIGVMTVGVLFSVHALTKKEAKVEQETKLVRANQVWYYHGTSSDLPTDASKYNLTPAEDCGGQAQTICKITAPANPSNTSQPDMSAVVDPSQPTITVADQITDALNSQLTNDTVEDFREFQ